jgi:hypothetical protein
MNKNDDEPWFLGVQFFGGTQFWPLLTQSHVFLGLKHLKKKLWTSLWHCAWPQVLQASLSCIQMAFWPPSSERLL